MHFAKSMLQFVFFACIIKIIVYFIIIKHQSQQTPLPCTSLRSPSPSAPLCFPPHVTPRNAPFIYGGATGREIFIRKNGFFHRGYPFFLKIEIAKNFFRKILKILKTDLVFFMVYIVFISKNDVII